HLQPPTIVDDVYTFAPLQENSVVQRLDVAEGHIPKQFLLMVILLFLSSAKPCRSDVLLKTAIAQVNAVGMSIAANLLLDEGARRSFITQKLVDRLHLQGDGSDVIHLSAFREPEHTVQILVTATVYIESDDEGSHSSIDCPAKQIKNHFRNSIMNKPYLRNLNIFSPWTELYWEIVGDKTISGAGPTAVGFSIGNSLSRLTATQLGTFCSTTVNVIATHVSETKDIAGFGDIDSFDIKPEEDQHLLSYRLPEKLFDLFGWLIYSEAAIEKRSRIHSYEFQNNEEEDRKKESMTGTPNFLPPVTSKFSRPFFTTTQDALSKDNLTLHVFVDASSVAFGAVSYFTSGDRSTIAFAKNRVAPVKEITLPRLKPLSWQLSSEHVLNTTSRRQPRVRKSYVGLTVK
ncbi:LOW QUALITY PROTEIN: hypothetical protein MAR_020263, partial [Mya arenaria]